MEESIRIPYYYATFKMLSGNSPILRTIVDFSSHPFIYMKIQEEMRNIKMVCEFWKEITKEEYDYYHANLNTFV